MLIHVAYAPIRLINQDARFLACAHADGMSSMAVVFNLGPGIDDPMTTMKQWDDDEYPPMGSPADVCNLINSWITTMGLESEVRDDCSGVILPDGVAGLSFQVHRDTVRSILITRPTGELLELLCRYSGHIGWRVFDVGSLTECLPSEFT